MEELNNRQIVLLCAFISFVVSIATGIITVAMLEEAPQTITQTVNRVVERTIERVVPDEDKKPNTPPPVTTVTKEVTVLAKEDDLIVSAVEKNQPRIASIFLGGMATTGDPIAVGFIVSRDGLVVADASKLIGDGAVADEYIVTIGSDTYTAKPMTGQEKSDAPVFFLKINGLPEGKTFDAVSFGSAMTPKVAQTLIVIGGANGENISKTNVSKLRYSKGEGTTTPQVLIGIETNPALSRSTSGSLVVNLDAQVVGIAVWSPASERIIIYPGDRIFKLVGSAGSSETKVSSEMLELTGT
jgi:hypothetical protein